MKQYLAANAFQLGVTVGSTGATMGLTTKRSTLRLVCYAERPEYCWLPVVSRRFTLLPYRFRSASTNTSRNNSSALGW